MTSKEIKDFQTFILTWYKKNKRDLPWRKTRDQYKILISEVMSQQTQISRVVPKYLSWIEKFPTIESLAGASKQDVLTYWSGLGYNRRALYLQKCAQEIVTRYNGVFPQTEKELIALPGIGEYTARALLCFAFNKQLALIDTNIKKVVAVHFFQGDVPEKKILKSFAAKLVPIKKAYEWNQALMDYAAIELKKEKIPVPKQSSFKDSDRFYRGQIIKYLVANKTVSKAQLQKLFAGKIDNERLQSIIITLLKDTLIFEQKKNMYSLS